MSDQSSLVSDDVIVVPKKTLADNVGHFQYSSTVMEIHTKQAASLWEGVTKQQKIAAGRKVSNAYPTYGLKFFAWKLTEIVKGSAADDPYADQLLIQLEVKIAETLTLLQSQKSEAEALLHQGSTRLRRTPLTSSAPSFIEIGFRVPYAHDGAEVLCLYDEIVCLLQACKNTNKISKKHFDQLQYKARNLVESLYHFGKHYPGPTVTRADILMNNERAKLALQQYGDLNPDIVTRKISPLNGPSLEKSH